VAGNTSNPYTLKLKDFSEHLRLHCASFTNQAASSAPQPRAAKKSLPAGEAKKDTKKRKEFTQSLLSRAAPALAATVHSMATSRATLSLLRPGTAAAEAFVNGSLATVSPSPVPVLAPKAAPGAALAADVAAAHTVPSAIVAVLGDGVVVVPDEEKDQFV
jgi:hypothetical protein